MENDKPFKTIEVIDSKTNQTCKVACMSCIRGHRTTSCGIPVCRNKIFWTVKRPGRPSNSCTCRYGATGGCKCVVAKSACPHKPKRGEKRSGECRCDEQGRYCCLLDPGHWTVLVNLQKPTVDFYSTREALDARYAPSTPMTIPATPPYSTGSPQTLGSVVSTPRTRNVAEQMHRFSGQQHGLQSPHSATLTPRFGMMGIGVPQGPEEVTTPEVLSWEGKTSEAPQSYQPFQYEQPQEQRSCCQVAATPEQREQYAPFVPDLDDLLPPVSLDPFANDTQITSVPEQQQTFASTFDFNKLSNDYFAYQFPSAICQTCGLNGCTCRNCPPVMQNFSTGSWAQCCGRKHARTAAYVPDHVQATFETPQEQPLFQPTEVLRDPLLDEGNLDAVSYTHLTLPTIYSV